MPDKITFNRDEKFDLQLSQAMQDELRLAGVISNSTFDKLELKSEQWQWEQTGCIAIEFSWNGRPSGIASTEADVWVHELKRNGETLMYIWVPMDRLKELCRLAFKAGDHRSGGDGGKSKMVLLKLMDLLR